MDNYKVYIHTNAINGKKYVGLTKQECKERWRHDGLGYQQQKKFFNAILKYGWDNFQHDIVAENLTAEEAGELEKQLIDKYNTIANGYNISPGGSTTNHSPETLEKMRQSMLGKKHSEETKELIRQSKKDEWIAVICIDDNIIYESINGASRATGVDDSSIVKCCQGKMMSAGGKKWRYADPIRAKQYQQIIDNQINKAKKPVYCITTDTYYETVREGAKDTHCDESNLIKVCKGKYKTTNGLKWRYATWEEFNQKLIERKDMEE